MSTATAEALKVELQAKLATPGVRIDKVFHAETKDVDGEKHTVTNVISSASIDRDMETVLPSAFKRDKGKRFPFVSSHDYSDLRKQIGDLSFKVRDDAVEGAMQYLVGKGNPEADWAFTLAQHNMARFSIGFRPVKWEDANLDDEKTINQVLAGKIPLRTYTEIELYEVSQVVVPSNRDAVQQAVSKGLVSDAEGKKIIDLLELFEKKDAPAPEPDLGTPEGYSVGFMAPERQVVTDKTLTFTMDPKTVASARVTFERVGDGYHLSAPKASEAKDTDVLAAFDPPAPEQKADPTPPRESIIIAKTLKVAAFGEGGPDEVMVLDVDGKDVWRGTPDEMVEALTTVHRTVNVTWNFDPAPFDAFVEKITAHLDTALKAGKEDLAEMVSKLPNIPSDVATQSQLAALAKSVGTAIHDNAVAIATQEVQKALSDPSVFRLNK